MTLHWTVRLTHTATKKLLLSLKSAMISPQLNQLLETAETSTLLDANHWKLWNWMQVLILSWIGIIRNTMYIAPFSYEQHYLYNFFLIKKNDVSPASFLSLTFYFFKQSLINCNYSSISLWPTVSLWSDTVIDELTSIQVLKHIILHHFLSRV